MTVLLRRYTRVLVRNKSNRKPEENVDWIQLWKDATGKKNPGCSNLTSCTGESDYIVGGHVYLVDKDGKAINPGEYYIVPLCNSCNSSNKTEPFEVYKHLLVKESDLLK